MGQVREPQAALGNSPGQLSHTTEGLPSSSTPGQQECVFPLRRKGGLRVSNEGKEQSSSGQIPALPQPKGTPAPWSHILLGTQGKQSGLSSPTQSGGCAAALGHSCSPALPITHIPSFSATPEFTIPSHTLRGAGGETWTALGTT